MDPQDPAQPEPHMQESPPEQNDSPAAPETGVPLVPEPVADRVRRYARMLIGLGVSTGAMLVVAFVYVASAARGGERGDWLIGIVAALLGVAQAVMATIRYRQLSRYLRCGSASTYEDLVRAAEGNRPPPEA